MKTCTKSTVIAALLLGTSATWAQPSLNEVIVTAQPPLGIAGFDATPPSALPLSYSMIMQSDLRDIGAQRISGGL